MTVMSDLLTPLSMIVLWLDFTGLTTLIGTLAFQCAIIRRVSLSPRGFEPVERRLLRVEAVAIMLLAMASVLELLLRALAMGGGILGNIGNALPSLLLEKHGYEIEAFGVKEVVGNHETKTVSFKATKAGIFPIKCQLHKAENHYAGQLVVLE